MTKTNVNKINIKVNQLKMLDAKLDAALSDSLFFILNIGINTDDSAPSPNILLKRDGNLIARLKLSAISVVPNAEATIISLTTPKNLDRRVKEETIIPDLSKDIYNIV
jgi:hypothetical protein